MSEETLFFMPDYMPSFRCKMGACRCACCEGWPITISMTDYFRLLGVDCSAELRHHIDCAMHMHPHPTQDGYAQILPRWDGNCPLRLEDGRCGLQAELGEDMLAAVCRLYPRGVRMGDDGLECSCANSCEAVVETLYREEAVRFVKGPLHVTPPPMGKRLNLFETAGRESDIRGWLISFLQNRQYPLSLRMMHLGQALYAMDQALHAKDFERVNRLLSGEDAVPPPEMTPPGHAQLLYGLEAAEKMLAVMERSSDSIRDYGEWVLAHFGGGETAFDKYEAACEHLTQVLPHWESWMENLMVNHMFFVQFPFQDRPVSLRDEFTALCAVYVLLRCLCVGWMADKDDPVAAMDVAAAVFRLVDHTEFDRYAAPILHGIGCDDWEHLKEIVSL